MMTKTDAVGIVTPGIEYASADAVNAFYAGAFTANVSVRTIAKYTRSYDNRSMALGAARDLVSMGTGCIVSNQDNDAAAIASLEAGLVVVGTQGFSLRDIYGESVGISFLVDWSPAMRHLFRTCKNSSGSGSNSNIDNSDDSESTTHNATETLSNNFDFAANFSNYGQYPSELGCIVTPSQRETFYALAATTFAGGTPWLCGAWFNDTNINNSDGNNNNNDNDREVSSNDSTKMNVTLAANNNDAKKGTCENRNKDTNNHYHYHYLDGESDRGGTTHNGVGGINANLPRIDSITGCIADPSTFGTSALLGIVDGGYYETPITYSSFIKKSSFVSVVSFAVLAMWFPVVAIVMVAYLWHDDRLTYGGKLYLVFLSSGCFVVTGSAISWAVEPTSRSCVSRVWLPSIGATLAVGSLIIKNAVIWRACDSAQRFLRRKPVTLCEFASIIAVMLILNSVILAVFAALGDINGIVGDEPDDSDSSNTNTSYQGSADDSNGCGIGIHTNDCGSGYGADTIRVRCTCSYSRRAMAAIYAVLAYHGIQILLGCALSYKLSTIKVPAFNERRAMAMVLYMIVFCMVIIGVVFGTSKGIAFHQLSLSIAVVLIIVSTCSLVVVAGNRFRAIFFHGHDDDGTINDGNNGIMDDSRSNNEGSCSRSSSKNQIRRSRQSLYHHHYHDHRKLHNQHHQQSGKSATSEEKSNYSKSKSSEWSGRDHHSSNSNNNNSSSKSGVNIGSTTNDPNSTIDDRNNENNGSIHVNDNSKEGNINDCNVGGSDNGNTNYHNHVVKDDVADDDTHAADRMLGGDIANVTAPLSQELPPSLKPSITASPSATTMTTTLIQSLLLLSPPSPSSKLPTRLENSMDDDDDDDDDNGSKDRGDAEKDADSAQSTEAKSVIAIKQQQQQPTNDTNAAVDRISCRA